MDASITLQVTPSLLSTRGFVAVNARIGIVSCSIFCSVVGRFKQEIDYTEASWIVRQKTKHKKDKGLEDGAGKEKIVSCRFE